VSELPPSQPGGVDELASGPGHQSRRSSPWAWRVAGLLAVALVVVVVRPHLLSSPDPRRDPSASSTPSAPALQPNPAPVVDPLSWPPRGPGIGSAFARAALARLRAERADVDRLLWVGSLDGGDQVAVVAYRPPPDRSPGDGVEVAALRVLRGDDDLSRVQSQPMGNVREAGSLVGLAWRGTDSHTRILVLASPASMPVQLSSVIDYHPNGRIGRRWRDAELADGVLVTDLGRNADPVIVVRPKDLGSITRPALVQVHGLRRPPGADEVTVAGTSSPSYAGPDVNVLVDSLAQAVSMLTDLRDCDSRVLWSGELAGGRSDSGGKITGRGALVLVRRRDGPVLQTFVFTDPTGKYASSTADPVPWSVAARLPYAFTTYQAGAPLLLISPNGAGSATLTPSIGPPMRVRLDKNGVATLATIANTTPSFRFTGADIVVRNPVGRTVLHSTMVDPGTADAFGAFL
jgi:hypothetical protein